MKTRPTQSFIGSRKPTPTKPFFGSRKPTHSEQIRQLVAENTMLKMRLESANKEQRSLEYWKAVVGVVSAEMQQLDQSSIKEDTPYSEVIEMLAKNIVARLEEAEKNKDKEQGQPEKKAEENAETDKTI